MAKSTEKSNQCEGLVAKVEVENKVQGSKKFQPNVDQNHLSPEKWKIVADVLYEKCEAFARDDDDIGSVTITRNGHKVNRPSTSPKIVQFGSKTPLQRGTNLSRGSFKLAIYKKIRITLK